ncbi:unnamed protein product, partial [Laminaria digitata]
MIIRTCKQGMPLSDEHESLRRSELGLLGAVPLTSLLRDSIPRTFDRDHCHRMIVAIRYMPGTWHLCTLGYDTPKNCLGGSFAGALSPKRTQYVPLFDSSTRD